MPNIFNNNRNNNAAANINGKIKSLVKDTDVLGSNLFFPDTINNDTTWYNKVNRYGWINPYNHDRVIREYLFFTKPDLYLFDGSTANVNNLVSGVKDNSVIYEAASRMPKVLTQLQYSITDPDGKFNPFMYLLTNAVKSKLDLPGISADSNSSTENIMGTNIHYRSHSLKSDNGYDFSLSFTDTAYLEIYTLAKCYDEYMRLIKLGEAEPKEIYITNRIIPEQFSIYKFLVGSDGETILYYAKLTGCYFTDVPRSDLSDPGEEIKFSLSFHAQFVEDMNPQILKEFDIISNRGGNNFMSVFNGENVNNQWAKYPRVIRANKTDPIYGKRVARRGVEYDYFLKWIK